MGGGPTDRGEGPKAPAVNLVQAASAGIGIGDALAPDAVDSGDTFCSREQPVGFRAHRSPRPRNGSRVHLAIGRPLRVISDGAEVGEIEPDLNDALTRCLELDYELRGHVETLDSAAGRGILIIAGEKREN
jgi:hypothetical protein